MSEPLTEDDLVNIIKGHKSRGLGSEQGEISNDRQYLFDRYYGEVYGNERDGESRVTTRDIQETIEWALPGLMRHFTGNGRPVEFEAEDPRDTIQAQQETDAVTNQFWKDNHGFTTLYLTFKAVMLNPNAYVKVYRDERERALFDHYQSLSLNEVAMIEDDPELELVESTPVQDETFGEVYDVKVRRLVTRGRNIVTVIPEDEALVDNEWTQLDLDDCPFVMHYPEKTHSELVEMGYDGDELDNIYGSGDSESSEESNRQNTSDESNDTNQTVQRALRKYTYHECSMLVDWDNDGIAERRRVVMINDEIFDNEEDAEVSMIAGATILMPHKHVGISLAQTVTDLQDIRTTIWRQTFDNMYRMNNPRTIVLKGANLQDVLANRRNGILRAKTRDDISIEETKPIIGQVIPLLQLLDDAKEMRTGITRQSTVPDPDVLQQTAQGSYLAMVERADQRLDLLARLFAETLVKRIYIKLHALIKRHGDMKYMKWANGWMISNPATWRTRETMTVRVGLGTGSQQGRLLAANRIVADHDTLIERQLLAIPEQGRPGLITLRNVYEGRRLMVESLGEHDIQRYYTDPDTIPKARPQPSPPDPNILMIQSNERIEGQKIQVEIAKLRADQQSKMFAQQANFAMEERKMRFGQLEQAFTQRIEQMEMQYKVAAQEDKARADRLKLELDALKAELADAQQDEKLVIEKYKADLDAETRIAVKELEVGAKAIDKLSTMEESQQLMQTNQQQVNDVLARMSNMIDEMRAPKEIVYDEAGEIVGVKNPLTGEVKNLRRDADGNPVGL